MCGEGERCCCVILLGCVLFGFCVNLFFFITVCVVLVSPVYGGKCCCVLSLCWCAVWSLCSCAPLSSLITHFYYGLCWDGPIVTFFILGEEGAFV